MSNRETLAIVVGLSNSKRVGQVVNRLSNCGRLPIGLLTSGVLSQLKVNSIGPGPLPPRLNLVGRFIVDYPARYDFA